MNKKNALTKDGITGFCLNLYLLKDDDLRVEACMVADNLITYLSKHFELQVGQLEFLRNLGSDLILIIGWQAAIAFLSRRPILFTDMLGNSGTCGDKCILTNIKLSTHFDDGMITSSGQLEIRI